MQTFTFVATNATNDAPLPGATVTVYFTGTTTLASLYNASGVGISNPTTTDSNARVVFQIADGAYDIIASLGAYTAPTLQAVQIVDQLALSSIVSGLQGSVGGGNYGFQTVSAMNAYLTASANSIAQVFNDPTPSADGTYLKVGASGSGYWSQVSNQTLASLYTALQATNAALAAETAARQAYAYGAANCRYAFADRPVLLDLAGAITGAPTVYLPIYINLKYAVSGGTTYAFAGTAGNTASTHRNGYCEFALPSGGLIQIVFDFVTNTYRSFTYPNFADATLTNYVIVFQGYRTGYDCVWSVHENDYPVTALNYTLALDGSTLYVPAIQYYADDGTYNPFANSDGSLYTEVALANDAVTGSVLTHVYFDSGKATLGVNPIVATAYPAADIYAPPQAQTIARIFHGQIESPWPVAQMVKNEYQFGGSNLLAPYLYNDTAQASVTDSALTALGFSNGYQSPTTFSAYGGPCGTRRSAGYGFVRLYVQAVGGSFGTPQVFWQDQQGNNHLVGNMLLEKVLSSTARIYCLKFALSPNGIVSPFGFLAGTYVGSGPAPIICGLQYGFGDSPAIWISRSDYPLDGRPPAEFVSRLLYGTDAKVALIPSDIFLVRGRRAGLHWTNMFQSASEGLRYRGTLELLTNNNADPPYLSENGPVWEVTPPTSFSATNGFTSGTIEFRDKLGPPDRRDWKSVAVHTAPASQSTTRSVLVIGDSKSNRLLVALISAKLTAMGITPTFIGTVRTANSLTNTTDATGPLGECREGRGFADYVNIDNTNLSPITSWSTYLAASKSTQVTYNPFIRAATGGDPAGNIKNGYVFDFSNYLTQGSLATPQDVIINLGVNDWLHYTAPTGLTNIETALPLIYASIRAKSSSIRIGIGMDTLAKSLAGDNAWEGNGGGTGVAAFAAYVLQFVAGKQSGGDANVYAVPTWAAMSRDAGWRMDSSISTDAFTGTNFGILAVSGSSETIHPGLANVHALAETWAAFVAAGAAGV